MGTAFLLWLDGSPTRYRTAAWVIFSMASLAAIGAAIPARRWSWWRHPAVFLTLAFLAILAFRWPILADNRRYLDPDESQIMSGALTLAHDARFWLSVDGSNHGLLDELPLLIPRAIGVRVDYTSARFMSSGFAWIGVLCATLIFRRLFGPGRGALLALPLLAVNAFTDCFDFVQYGAEHSPDALVAGASWLLLTAWNSTGRNASSRRLFLAGLALGAAPFAKLQVVPLVAWIALWGYWSLATEADARGRVRRRNAVLFTSGIAAFPALMAAGILALGLWDDFWRAHIADNIGSSGGRWFTWAQTPAKFIELCGYPGGFGAYLYWMAGVSAAGLFALPVFERWQRRCALFALGLTLAAACAAMAPGRMHMHYLQLLIFPAGLLAGIVAGAGMDALTGRPASLPRVVRVVVPAAILVFLVVGLAPQVAWRAASGQPALGRFTRTRGQLEVSPVAREILRHARPGQTLGIWGWMPGFWIETGLTQATRDGNDARQIDDTPARPYYRARFMGDLRRATPPVFIDAVGGENYSYTIRAASGHETFPELADYLSRHYRQVADTDGTRIYVRNGIP